MCVYMCACARVCESTASRWPTLRSTASVICLRSARALLCCSFNARLGSLMWWMECRWRNKSRRSIIRGGFFPSLFFSFKKKKKKKGSLLGLIYCYLKLYQIMLNIYLSQETHSLYRILDWFWYWGSECKSSAHVHIRNVAKSLCTPDHRANTFLKIPQNVGALFPSLELWDPNPVPAWQCVNDGVLRTQVSWNIAETVCTVLLFIKENEY